MSEPVGLFVTKSDYAYTRIREGILSGEFGPGTRAEPGGAGQDDRHQHHPPA